MKVWITKYALTKGIIPCEIRTVDVLENGYIRYMQPSGLGGFMQKGNGWEDNEKSAIKKAEKMRQKKIESLKKNIEKLERLKFE